MLVSNPSSPPLSTESRILVVTSMGHLLCHTSELAFFGLITALVADPELDLTIDQASLLPVPGLVLYGIGALPTGIFTDRFGSRKALSIYFLAVMVACLAIYFAGNAREVCLGLTLLGAAISIYHPASLAMLSLGCAKRGRAMGINGVAGSLGVAIGLSLGLLVITRYSWRATYLIIAGLALLGFVCSLAMQFKLPVVEPSPKKSHSSYGEPLVLLPLLFVAMLVGGFNYRCLTTVLPAYLSGTAETNGGIVFLVVALGGLGQLVGGFLADRYRPALLYVITIMTTIPLALAIARLPLSEGTWLAGALAIFMFSQQPFENTLIAEVTPAKYRSTMYGLKFVLAFGIASIGAYVAGLTWRYAGLVRVFDIYAAGAIVMAVLAAGVAFVSRPGAASRFVAAPGGPV